MLKSNGDKKNAYNRLLHASTSASSVALVSGVSTIGTLVTIVGFPISIIIQRGDPSQHRSQGIVEIFNRTLADRLFTYQYHKEL